MAFGTDGQENFWILKKKEKAVSYILHDFSIVVHALLYDVFIISMQMYLVVAFVIKSHSFSIVTDMGI